MFGKSRKNQKWEEAEKARQEQWDMINNKFLKEAELKAENEKQKLAAQRMAAHKAEQGTEMKLARDKLAERVQAARQTLCQCEDALRKADIEFTVFCVQNGL